MFKDLPKLSDDDKQKLDTVITLDELKETLSTCKESAPGPDGLTYGALKGTWEVMGPLILASWSHSCKLGETSQTQRMAVISLLEKKGKDKRIIENLRPISLSNCDIKLCTKTLALRINTVLPSILSATQTGYIKGRQINDNSRLLEEIIDGYKKDNKIGYLITLDAQKAFDSVDHNYLKKILELFNFPETFIHQIDVIYKKLTATVMVNGFLGTTFNIEQSVKQGDALSCALFIIAIEPLLRQIQANDKIEGVTINDNNTNGKTHVNNMSYADDISAVCNSIEGIQAVIDEYVNFSQFSGIKLNIGKTEILVINKKQDSVTTFNIRYNNQIIKLSDVDKVKICGITFSNNKEIAYNENIINKITKLERQLNIWRQRNLTLQGKVLIVKTFGISQLIFSMQATHIRERELKLIENIIFRFIWNIKPTSPRVIGKIKRDTLKNDMTNGGLNAPDINAINLALKYKHILRCQQNNNHPVSTITNNILNEHYVNWNELSGARPKNDTYLTTAILAHTILSKKLLLDLETMSSENDGIHCNYFSFLQNITLKTSSIFPPEMSNTIKRLDKYNIKTMYDLQQEVLKKKAHVIVGLDSILAYTKIPLTFRKLLNKCKKHHKGNGLMLSIAINKWKPISNITTRDIYKRLRSKEHETGHEIINKRHGFNINNRLRYNPFKQIKLITTEAKLQNVQYKLLHNIYPTTSHLYKWKIKTSENCAHCNEIDNLKHTTYDCSIASLTLKKFYELIKQKLNIDILLKYEDIILGISTNKVDTQPLTHNQKLTIDKLIILIKRKLILQRENKCVITVDELNLMLEYQYKIEKHIAFKQSKLNKLEIKWGQIKPF